MTTHVPQKQNTTPTSGGYVVHGCHETVFSVSHLSRVANLYVECGGWEILRRGNADVRQAAAWGLPDRSPIEEVLIRAKASGTGFIRLVKFVNLPQRVIRSGGQAWDTGGLFDVDVRVGDAHAATHALQARGHNPLHDPVVWNFGDVSVRHVLVMIDDGICHAMIERVSPPLAPGQGPPANTFGPNFNSSVIVADMEQSTAFLRDGLGFNVVRDVEWTAAPQDGANIFGLPRNLARTAKGHARIFHPQNGHTGTVELISFDGIEGRSFAEFAKPPNLGVLMMRFPVENVRAYADALRSRGVALAAEPTPVTIAPYGQTVTFAVRTPTGAWLEFYEKTKP